METRTTEGYFDLKMRQAREAYGEAAGLLADGAELRYVVNSIYYAYYYPVVALLHAAGRSAGMQSVSLALFERLFRPTGLIDDRFFHSIRTAFDLKPKCTEPASRQIGLGAVEGLLRDARDFQRAVAEAARPENLAAAIVAGWAGPVLLLTPADPGA